MAGYCDIWDELKDVEKKYTKEFTKPGGFKGTDINSQHRMHRMTQLFGPVGVGWGYELVERWTEQFGKTTVVHARAKVWFMHEGEKRWTGEQIGATVVDRAPDEAYKSSVTDAIGKCMAQLGLGAAVYLGEFDGKYHLPQSQNTKSPPSNGQNANGAPPKTAEVYKPTKWQEVKIHFGKKQGTTLGELDDNSIDWWWNTWAGKREESELKGDDLWLWRGLRAAVEERGQAHEQQREEEPVAAIPDDCPF